MRHRFTVHYGICALDAQNKYCAICARNFFICERCGLFSGCLTTECPNYYAYYSMGTYVYFGVADYVDGNWVYPGTKIRIYDWYKEALRFVETSEYDLFQMPPPSNWVPDYA